MKKNSIFSMAAKATVVACVIAAFAGCCKKAPPRKVYVPLAPEGTVVGGVYETKGLAANPMMDFILDFSSKANARIAEAAAARHPELAEALAKTDAATLKKREIENLQMFDWVAFTVKKPAFTAEIFEDDDAVVPFPSAAIVYASAKPLTMADLEKKIKDDIREGTSSLDGDSRKELCDFFSENFEVSDDIAAGCAIKKFTLKDNDLSHELVSHVSGLAPCYGMFDDTLFIIASSPEAFAETVALYGGEAAKNSDNDVAADFELGGKEQCRYGLYGLQGLLADFLGSDYDKFDSLAGGCVKRIRALRAASAIDGESMAVRGSIRLVMDDAAAAKTLSGQIENSRGMVAMGAGFLAMRVPALSPTIAILNKFKTSGDDGVCAIELEAAKDDIAAIDFAAIVEQCQDLLPQGEDADDEGEENEGEE